MISFLLLLLCGSYVYFSPKGWDLDEAAILWNAKRVLEGQQPWSVFSPEFTRWEMLLGYFYAAIGLLKLPFLEVPWRVGPVLLRIVEVLLLFWALRQKIQDPFVSRVFAFLGLVFFAFNPWNFFYGDILGTCVGVVIWTLLLPALRKSLLAYGFSVLLMLMHYTSLRLLWFWELGRALYERSYRRAWLLVGVASVYAVLVSISSQLSDIWMSLPEGALANFMQAQMRVKN